MKRYAEIAAAAALLANIILFSGCSPTGWATKEMPDGSNIEQGKIVTVIQKDGSSITGKYLGMETIAAPDYSEQYDRAIQNNYGPEILPKIGETIDIRTSLTDSRTWEGEFLGFDYKSLWVKLSGDSEPSEFYITSLNRVSSTRGIVLHRSGMRNMYMNGQIPLMSAIVVNLNSKNVQIPLNTIDKLVEEPDLGSAVSLGN